MGFITHHCKPIVEQFITSLMDIARDPSQTLHLPQELVTRNDTYKLINDILSSFPETADFVKFYLQLACLRYDQILSKRAALRLQSATNQPEATSARDVAQIENPVIDGIVSAVPVKNPVLFDFEAGEAETPDQADTCHKYYLNAGVTGGRSGEGMGNYCIFIMHRLICPF